MKNLQKTFEGRLEQKVKELQLWEKLLKHYNEVEGINRHKLDYVKDNIRELRAEIKRILKVIEDIEVKRGVKI